MDLLKIITMRVDKAKNIKALKTELLKNPLQTEEELWKKIWIDRRSVNRLKEEMSEIVTNAKNSDIVEITDEDKFIIQMSQALSRHSLWTIINKLDDDPTYVLELREAKTASEIAKESTARYSLFRWSATDKEWGLKLPDITFQIINPNDSEDSSEAI